MIARKTLCLSITFFLLITGITVAQTGHNRAGQWQEDIDFLLAKIEEIHPNPYRRISRDEFSEAAKAFKQKLPELSENQRLVGLMRLVSLLEDGHTNVYPYLPDKEYAVFPFRMFKFQEGIFITVAPEDQKELVGAEVLTIGNLSAAEAFVRFEELIMGDNEFYRMAFAPRILIMADLLEGLGIIESNDVLPLRVRTTNGDELNVSMKSVAHNGSGGWFWWPFMGPSTKDLKYVHAFENQEKLPRFINRERRRYWFEHILESNMIYMHMLSFRDLKDESFEAFLDRMFRYMDLNNVDKLIYDIRWNSGGNGKLIWQLIYRIIKRDRINTLGNLFVITGRKSFSASVLSVAQMKQHTKCIVVGEPIAAPFNSYGDTSSVRLPHTGYLVYISDLYWQTGHPDDERSCVSPDVVVPVTAEDYFQGYDRALELILEGKAKTLLRAFREDGVEAGTSQYRQMLQAYDFPGWKPFSEREMHNIGRDLKKAGYLDEAMAAYTFNVEAFPKAWNAWDDLGEIYCLKEKYEQAIEFYRKSLEFNPGNSNAEHMIKEIKQKQNK